MGISTNNIGHASEYLVCFDLALRGLHAAPNIFEHCVYDVIADHNGQMLRIQVKGTLNKKKGGKGYQFSMHKTEYGICDLIALVAIDLKQVKYVRPPNNPVNAMYTYFEDVEQSNNEILNMIFKNETTKN